MPTLVQSLLTTRIRNGWIRKASQRRLEDSHGVSMVTGACNGKKQEKGGERALKRSF